MGVDKVKIIVFGVGVNLFLIIGTIWVYFGTRMTFPKEMWWTYEFFLIFILIIGLIFITALTISASENIEKLFKE